MLAARHAIRGSLPKVLGTLRHRQRYSGIRQMHQVAQRNYEARSMTVDLVLLQSAELARRPHVIERWRALAGSALEPIVMPATSHEGLMSAESDQVQRMAALVDWALSGPIDQPGRSEP